MTKLYPQLRIRSSTRQAMRRLGPSPITKRAPRTYEQIARSIDEVGRALQLMDRDIAKLARKVERIV